MVFTQRHNVDSCLNGVLTLKKLNNLPKTLSNTHGVHFETIKSFYLGQAWPTVKLSWGCCQDDKALDSKPVTLLQGGDCLNRSV